MGLRPTEMSWIKFPWIAAQTYRNFANDMITRFEDEMSSKNCFIIPAGKEGFFDPVEPIFGLDVESKFSVMSEDIAEAGKCLALERSTAAVFHLMRVMEIGVQRLCRRQVREFTFTSEKNWQKIFSMK